MTVVREATSDRPGVLGGDRALEERAASGSQGRGSGTSSGGVPYRRIKMGKEGPPEPGDLRTRTGKTRDAEFEKAHPRAAKGRTGGGRFIQKGQSGGVVNTIQTRLGIKSTGTMDPTTVAAIRRFQARHGLKVDGIVGHQTLAALRGDKDAANVEVGRLTAEDKSWLDRLGTRQAGRRGNDDEDEKKLTPEQRRRRRARRRERRQVAHERKDTNPELREAELEEFRDAEHPRDRVGRFREVRSKLPRIPTRLVSGVRVERKKSHGELMAGTPNASGVPPEVLAMIQAAQRARVAAADAREQGHVELAERHEATADRLEEASLVAHAREELKRAGLFSKDSDYDGMLGPAVMKVVKAFSGQGHSGGSAAITTSILDKLLRYKPLTPLTSAPSEWVHHDEKTWGEPGGIWQSKRDPAAFSKDGGKTWDVMEATIRLAAALAQDPRFIEEYNQFFDPTEHPRDRRGQFRETFPTRPKRGLAKVFDAGRTAQAEREEIMRKSPSAQAEVTAYREVQRDARQRAQNRELYRETGPTPTEPERPAEQALQAFIDLSFDIETVASGQLAVPELKKPTREHYEAYERAREKWHEDYKAAEAEWERKRKIAREKSVYYNPHERFHFGRRSPTHVAAPSQYDRDALARQIERARETAQRHGFSKVSEYEDDDRYFRRIAAELRKRLKKLKVARGTRKQERMALAEAGLQAHRAARTAWRSGDRAEARHQTRVARWVAEVLDVPTREREEGFERELSEGRARPSEPGAGRALQEEFVERRHPRDRRGRFREVLEWPPEGVRMPRWAEVPGGRQREAERRTAASEPTTPVIGPSDLPSSVPSPQPVELVPFSEPALREVYDGFYSKGLRVKLGPKRKGGPAYGEIRGRIEVAETGAPAGELKFKWYRYDDGITVEHEYVQINSQFQEQGWAAAFQDHVEDGYRRLGVKKIILTAAAIGSYAWATQGFTFTDSKLRWWPRLHKTANEGNYPYPAGRVRDNAGPEVLAELERFIRDTAEFPWQIAMWGREHAWVEDGHVMWPGKAYLLWNGWFGEKELS